MWHTHKKCTIKWPGMSDSVCKFTVMYDTNKYFFYMLHLQSRFQNMITNTAMLFSVKMTCNILKSFKFSWLKLHWNLCSFAGSWFLGGRSCDLVCLLMDSFSDFLLPALLHEVWAQTDKENLSKDLCRHFPVSWVVSGNLHYIQKCCDCIGLCAFLPWFTWSTM